MNIVVTTQVDRLKAEVYQSSCNARIKLFSPTATYKLMNESPPYICNLVYNYVVYYIEI